MSGLLGELRQQARRLTAETHALYLACRDPCVPWYAKAVVACIVGYALSPIDPIPDFIPVLGYLDELIVIPAGIKLALRLIPREVMEECREKARVELERHGRPKNWIAAGIIVMVWVAVLVWAVRAVARLWRP